MTVPSGADLSGYSLDKVEGVIFGDNTFGVGGGLSNLVNLTEDYVKAQDTASHDWSSLVTASEKFFDGLNPDGVASYALLVIRWLADKLGIETVLETMDDAGEALREWVAGLLSWLDAADLQTAVENLVTALTGIDWSSPTGVRSAVFAVYTFVRALGRWFSVVVENLTTIHPNTYTTALGDLFGVFHFPQLKTDFDTFDTSWSGIDWGAAGALHTGWMALSTFIRAINSWVLTVIESVLGIDSRDFFVLSLLKTAYTNFKTAWDAITFPDVLNPIKALWGLGKDLWTWVAALVKNLTGLDLHGFAAVFIPTQLKTAYSTLKTSWSAIGSFPDFVDAFKAGAHFVHDLWVWVLAVFHSFTGIDLTNSYAGFAISQLKDVYTTLVTSWGALTFPDIRGGFRAFRVFGMGLWGWVTTVFKNLTSIDLTNANVLDISTIKGVYSTFVTEWGAVSWTPVPQFAAAYTAVIHFIEGTWKWAWGVFQNVTGIDVLQIGAAFEFAELKTVWETFGTSWNAIDFSIWTINPDLKDVFRAVAQLIKGLWGWFMDVFLNFTGFDLHKFGQVFDAAGLRAVWDTFRTSWNAIDFSIWHIRPDFVDAFKAIGQLINGTWQWFLVVFKNITGVDLTVVGAAFEITEFKAAWSTFRTSWAAIDFTIWDTVPDLIDAWTAVRILVKSLIHWALDVVANFNVDIRKGLQAWDIPDLQSAISTFRTTLAGISWGHGGAIVAFIGAVVTFSKAVGNWARTVIGNLMGIATTDIHTLFSSVHGFIGWVMAYIFGDSTPWQDALNFLANTVDATIVDVAKKLYNDLHTFITFFGLSGTGDLKSWINGELSDALASATFLKLLFTTQWNRLIDNLGGAFGGSGIGHVVDDLIALGANLPTIAQILSSFGIAGTTWTDLTTGISAKWAKLVHLNSSGQFDVAQLDLTNKATSLLKNINASTFKYDVAQLDLTNKATSLFKYIDGTSFKYDVSQLDLTNQATSPLKYLTGSGTNIGQFAATQLTGALNTAVTIGTKAVSALFGSTGNFIGVLDSAATFGGNALSGVLAHLSATGTMAYTALTGLSASIGTFLSGSVSSVAQTLATSGTLAYTTLSGLASGVSSFLAGTGTLAYTAISGLSASISTFLGGSVSAIAQTLATSGTLAYTALSGLASGVTSFLSGAGTLAYTAITGLASSVTAFLGGTISSVAQTFITGGTLAASALTGALNTAVTFLVGGAQVALSTLLANLKSNGKFDVAQLDLTNQASSLLKNINPSTFKYDIAQLDLTNQATTIFKNINSSGLLLASGITGTIASGVQMAASQLTGALASGVSVLGTQVNATIGAFTTDVQTHLQTAASGIGQAINNDSGTYTVAAMKTNLSNWLTTLHNKLGGHTATAASYTDLGNTAASSLANSTNNSLGVADVAAQMGITNYGASGGISQSVNFGTFANTAGMPSIFTPVASSTFFNATSGLLLGISGGTATLVTGTTGRTAVLYNVTPTGTDNQSVSVVAATSAAQIFILGRGNSAGSTLVYAALNGTQLALFALVAGTRTQLGSTLTIPTLVAGATYTLLCGTSAGTRFYDVLCNGISLINTTGGISDPSTSQVGSTFRFGGCGASLSGALSSFTVADNLLMQPDRPATDSGSGNTTSTSYVTLSSPATVTITAGSSGMALVVNSAQISNNTTGASASASWAISGGITQAANDQYRLVNVGSNPIAGSRVALATGLTPGASHVFTQQCKVSAGTGTFTACNLDVIPL